MEDVLLSEKTSTATSKIDERQFKKSIFFPWAKFQMSFDRNQFFVRDRKYLLWIIPLGRKKDDSFPLNYVVEAIVQFQFGIGRALASLLSLYFYTQLVSDTFYLDKVVGIFSLLWFSPFLMISLYFGSKGVGYKLIFKDKKNKQFKKFDVSLWHRDELHEFADGLELVIKKRFK